MELRDSVALVTGSARGIGRVIAQALIDQGAKVALIDVLEDELQATAKAMQDQGATVLPLKTDITDPAQVDAMANQVESQLGPVDILVNNAGTFSVIDPVWEADPQRWFRDINVNLFGSFLMCRAVVKGMVERQQGYVFNMVSSGGVGDPHHYRSSYASSKAGLMRLTEGLAKEVVDYGIKVFAIAPPAVLTDMTRFIMDDPGGKKWRPDFKKIFEDHKDFPPEVVSDMILELLSGKADALSGRFIMPHRHNLDDLVAETDDIIERDLWTLRIRQ